MRIIATTPAENAVLEEISEHLKKKGICPTLTKYEDGFGITVWSVNDLDDVFDAGDWPHEKRLHFMEMYGEKIGGATDDAWERLNSYVDEYLENFEDGSE